MTYQILIADDEKEIRELLRLYLEKEGFAVRQAGNGSQALEIIETERIDLVIADIMMPEVDGYQFIKSLRKSSNIPVIVVSAKTENYEKILGLDLGADDYVTKPFDPLEVVARIKAQLRRYLSGSGMEMEEEVNVLRVGQLVLDIASCMLIFNEKVIRLTATEFNLMKLFMQSPGRVYTKQQLFEAVWQEQAPVDDNTIMVAISKLRSKLPEGSGVSIGTIRGLGYRLEV